MWTSAQSNCESILSGSHLLTDMTEEKHQALLTQFSDLDSFWLGLNDRAVEGNFVWDDLVDTPLGGPAQWDPATRNSDGKDCVAITRESGNKWVPTGCSISLPYVCEKDVDECQDNPCHELAVCANTKGSFTCTCIDGYTGDGFTCAARCTQVCNPNARCRNIGRTNYGCVCNDGFEGDGITCNDIDECRDSDACHAEHGYCINTLGSFECNCNPGYKPAENNPLHECEDVDECHDIKNLYPCSVSAHCDNYVGGFRCDCNAGYTGDGYTCEDMDECAQGSHNCHANATCVNQDPINNPAGFTCTCKPGFEGDGITCTGGQCPTLAPPSNGALSPVGATSHRDVVTFTCNQGYELVGTSTHLCRAGERVAKTTLRLAGLLPLRKITAAPWFVTIMPSPKKRKSNRKLAPATKDDGETTEQSEQTDPHLESLQEQHRALTAALQEAKLAKEVRDMEAALQALKTSAPPPTIGTPALPLTTGSLPFGGTTAPLHTGSLPPGGTRGVISDRKPCYGVCLLNWNLDVLCQAVQCQQLTAPANGVLSPTGAISYQNGVDFSCNVGYQLNGASRATCQADQTWSANVPTCTVSVGQCSTLTAPANGAISTTATSYNTVVTFTCNPGYVRNGATSTTCQEGTWSNPVPTCTPVLCSARAASANGAVSPTGAVSYPNGVTFTCNPGYILNGAAAATCRADRSWSNPVPTCRDIDACFANPCVTEATCTDNPAPALDATCTCNSVYTGDGFINGTGCSASSLQCPALLAPTNGILSPTVATSYQTVVTFTCNQGYLLDGASSATCQADGTWSNPVPTCRDINDCSPNPCKNGGDCTDLGNNFQCTCAAGYEGDTCQTDGTPFGVWALVGTAVGCLVAGVLLGVAAILLILRCRKAKSKTYDTAEDVYESVRTPGRAASQRSGTGSDAYYSYPMVPRPLPPPLPSQPRGHYQDLRPAVYQGLQKDRDKS
ncbi:hypothetical protein Bbelb_216630 [Branchiostoma belcheri]|nr:hypothetical protein Bbelb_216630 [Branchiostoma belcheri]